MNALSKLLDLELDRLGWTESNRHFEDMVSALRLRDYPAYDAAKARFEQSMNNFPRGGSAAQEAAPGNINGD